MNTNPQQMNRRAFIKHAAIGTLATTAGCATVPAPRDESILIIGAGISGIAAARVLSDSGFRVTVLEGQNTPGGRIKTLRTFENPIDLGAAWIHGSRKNPITDLARSAGVRYEKTDWTRLTGYRADGSEMKSSEISMLNHNLVSVYRKAYWKEATEHTEDQIADLLKNKWKRTSIKEEDIHRQDDILNPIEQRELEALRQAALQADREYKEFSGGDQLVVDGYDRIFQSLLPGLTIHLGQRVQSIDFQVQGIKVKTMTETYTADRVLCTLPLGVLQDGSITFTPELPPEKQDVLSRLGMTTLNKVILKYDNAFWPKEPHALVHEIANKSNYALFFNQYHYSSEPILVYMATTTEALALEEISERDAVFSVANNLKKIFGSRTPDPSAGIRTRWNTNPFSRGSFSYRKAGTTPKDRRILAKPIENRLFFAGEATHDRMYATVHGAYLSGLRAAKEIQKLS